MPDLKILFLGDVVGEPGRRAITNHLPALKEQEGIHFVICNGENAAGGFGITTDTAQEMYLAGVDVITLGNHTWDKPGTEEQLAKDWKMLRPLNYPPGTPGAGQRVYPLGDGRQIAVVNLMGRLFMETNLDCPFQASEKLLQHLELGVNCSAIVVDVHAETASEKRCLGGIWDGRASLVVGSHTHCPTADAHIMPGGTGYQTDAGMCGNYNSSLGMDLEKGTARFTRKGRVMLDIAKGEGTLCGTLATINDKGLCSAIRPIRIGPILENAR